MIIASCRRNFYSTLFLSSLQIRQGGRVGTEMKLTAVASALSKSKVTILIHGYHTGYQNAMDAYSLIENKCKAVGIGDNFIGFLWPGSPIALGFFPAISRATKAGECLLELLWALNQAGCTITVETHSLGARVALQAIKLGVPIKRLLLTAPAVDDGVLVVGGEFCRSMLFASSVAVMYSANDPVLRSDYWWAELILEHRRVHALGLDGPETPIPINVQTFDMSNEIYAHSAYKDCDGLYSRWRNFIK